jgi:hypothetical protein
VPDSSCAEPAASATAKVHCLNPRRVSVLPRFIAPGSRRAGARRRRLAAPMWEPFERWRKANVDVHRRAPPARRARRDGMRRGRTTRLAALSRSASRISEDLVDPRNQGLQRLDICARRRRCSHRLRPSGHAVRSPLGPTRALCGAPPAATSPSSRECAALCAAPRVTPSSGTTARPPASAADGGLAMQRERPPARGVPAPRSPGSTWLTEDV